MTIERLMSRAAAFGALVVLAILTLAAPAAAHGDHAEIEVGEAEAVDALTIEFPIRMTYTGDGHAVEEVEGLVVSGTGPDGAALGPLDAFTPGDAPGVFRARIELPSEGTWELLIEAADPEARATLTADAVAAVVAPDDEPEAEPPVGAAPPGDPGDAIEDDPATVADPDDDVEAAADADEDDDSGINLALVLVAIAVFVAVAVAGVVLTRKQD